MYHHSQSSILPKSYYIPNTVALRSHSSAKTPTKVTNAASIDVDGSKERIRKLFKKVEISVSSYDTAWVAMIPRRDGYDTETGPLFPECLDWLLNNQLHDGSWGLGTPHTPYLLKSTLSSTLASILALKRWGAGQQHINKGKSLLTTGLEFMHLNFHSAIDTNHHSPTGFDIIFPGMLDYAKELDLKLPLQSTLFDTINRNREFELKRYFKTEPHLRDTYLAYVSEGIGKSQDWEMVMKFQRKNGSLFNSPATTAAAIIHHLPSDANLLHYIRQVLNMFEDAVPTCYPQDTYVRLCMIDNLERLGIDRLFLGEIQIVLDETYSCWKLGDENIFTDVSTCAIAFRLLRMNGYDVSSDPLIRMTEENYDLSSRSGHIKGISDMLELYKASQIVNSIDNPNLRAQNLTSSRFLKHMLSDNSLYSNKLSRHIRQEVEDAIKFPIYASLERIASRRYIEQYNVDTISIRVQKSAYSSPNIGNMDFFKLAVEDFNSIQYLHQSELKHLESWLLEAKLEKLEFSRHKAAYCLFAAVATIFTPELSDARMTWAKNATLTVYVDDFFDIAGTEGEFINLIQLIEKWDVDLESDCCSKEVRTIFSAIRNVVIETADKAFICQGRNVTSHIIKIWLVYLKSMWAEYEWSKRTSVPTLDEYFEYSHITFALGPIILASLYVMGPELSDEAVHSPELNYIFKLVSTYGRILNDIQSIERETEQGRLNTISLLMFHGGNVTKEEAIDQAKKLIENQWEQALSLSLKQRSIIPKACRELFWKMSKVIHLFYGHDDGLTLGYMAKSVINIIDEQISVTLP